jgi:hypothetical protein
MDEDRIIWDRIRELESRIAAAQAEAEDYKSRCNPGHGPGTAEDTRGPPA